MTMEAKGSRLTDPRYCIEEARRLIIPVNEANWELVAGDADALNVLQAAVTHLVYADAELDEFQEQLLQTVFTAYLLGRTADERREADVPEAFRTFIEGVGFVMRYDG